MTKGRSEPNALQLVPSLEALDERMVDEIGHRAEVEGAQLSDADLSHRDLSGSTWSQVVFAGSLANSDLANAILTDMRLDRADCANVTLRGASLVRVEFLGGRLLGLSMPEALLRDVVVRDAVLDLAGMRFAQLQRVVFSGCRMREADLSNANLQSVLFEDCDFTGADFSKATFERCELRNCTLDGVRGARDFSGITMSMVDVIDLAPLFAQACGVAILDPPELGP